MKTTTRLTILCLSISLGATGKEFKTLPISDEVAKTYKLDNEFYSKGTLVQDILIATSSRVSDFAHAEAAYLFNIMMERINPDVAERIRQRKPLCLLIGHDELTSDLPQFQSDKTGKDLDFYNWRNRGFLTWRQGRPLVVFTEEDTLEYEGGMQLESILIHEFGHVIHGAGFSKEQQERLTAAFNEAREKGIWFDGRAAQRFRRVEGKQKVSLLEALTIWFPEESPELLRKCLNTGDIEVNGKRVDDQIKVNKEDKVLIRFGGPKRCYAWRNRSEYWAEGVQCWYDTNRTMDHDHNHIHTREQLKNYDHALAKLCEEVLGNDPWRFISPRERAGQDHLNGYEPKKAPKVEDLPHIQKAAYDYYDNYWKGFWQRLYDKHGFRSPRTKSLFNGEDLDGWKVDVPHLDKNPNGKVPFVVREGLLVSLGKPNGHLVHQEINQNYRLEVEYRFVGKPGNCGVLVHASKPRALYKMFPKSIEVQMYHKNAGDFWCIVENIKVPNMEKRRGAPEKWGITEGKARRILNLTDGSENEPGQWNQMNIEVLDDEIKAWVNGDLVNHGYDCTAKKGKIAIQAEGSEVEFRKIDFTPINVLTK
ncbi:MAG: family 16 glycoside hydrolase [Opitutae bacterium]